jgi:hypothetical protein
MFLTELNPIVKEITQQPIAFFSGFFSGVLRLDLAEDPLKSWLKNQGVDAVDFSNKDRDNNNGPQSIDIE